MSRSFRMALDEAAEAMSKAALQKALDLEVAEREVFPIVGEVFDLKSAEDVYRYALNECGIDLEGIDPSAFRAMVRLLDGNGKIINPKDDVVTGMDQAPATDSVSRAIARIKFA